MQPDIAPVRETIDDLTTVLRGHRLVALTGAGCSTESGIPDYRGPETRRRARNPVQGREFARSAEVRQRYWARAVVGWERFSRARPNPAHRALAEMESSGVLAGIITQNVDGLHHAAGSRRVIELHGTLSEVACLVCGAIEPRGALQERLLRLNPGWLALAAEMAPDGDAELPAEHAAGFRIAACLRCDGPLKPRVVFFGENVARPVVEAAYALLETAGALLVVGSSLAVFSGYRFVRWAAEHGLPIAMVNLGPLRGEELSRVKIDAKAGEILPRLAEALAPSGLDSRAERPRAS